jgi:diaminopimelate decarboxylase
MIKQVAARIGKRCNVTVRLIAGVGTRSHIGLQTALDTSKFGISPAEARYVMLSAIQNEHLVNLAGIHVHVGSQTPDITPYRQAFGAMWEHLVWLYGETGHKLGHINIGGGIPVNYLRDRSLAREFVEETRTMLEADLTAAEMIDAAVGAVRDSARLSGALELLEDLEIVMEPGRSVIADAGTILMLSMVMYQWYYHAIDASRADEPHTSKYKMAGPLCDGGDVYFDIHGESRLPDYRLLPDDVEVGEVIAMLNTGAYTMAQMTAYNGRPFPAAVMIHDGGRIETLRRQDTYEDLLLNEN